MRRYIFTDRERRLLKAWLEEEETQETRNILSWIRKGWPLLAEDLTLLFQTVKAMMRRRRWKGRVTGRSEFESALRRAESALTRARRGRNTSDASRM